MQLVPGEVGSSEYLLTLRESRRESEAARQPAEAETELLRRALEELRRWQSGET